MKKSIKEQEQNTFVTSKGGTTEIVPLTDKEARKLKKDPNITGIETAKGKEIKEQEQDMLQSDEIRSIAKEVGKALGLALEEIGDEVTRAKIINIESDPQGGSFEIVVTYKEDKVDEFSFYVSGKSLHLADFDFDKEIGEVGVLPSGEPLVSRDILKNNFVKHFRSLYLESNIAKTSDGKPINVGDILVIEGTKFKVEYNIEKQMVELRNSVHKNFVITASQPSFKTLIRKSIKEDSGFHADKYLFSVGHVDDEPDMLKKEVYDIAVYAVKLYKALCKYDKMDAHVDFPNWWQSKIIKARDYISKAQHYLEHEDFEYDNKYMDADMLREEITEGQTGLMIAGRTKEDNILIEQLLTDLGIYGEFDTEHGHWFLPEKEEMYDELESILQYEFDQRNINATFEGVF